MGLPGTPVGEGCLFEIWQRMDLSISSDTAAELALTVKEKQIREAPF